MRSDVLQAEAAEAFLCAKDSLRDAYQLWTQGRSEDAMKQLGRVVDNASRAKSAIYVLNLGKRLGE